MSSLSVVIVACDEENTIGRVIDAVKPIADEIVLVDSGSKDRTREIAEAAGARVMHQDWLGYAAQKNFAMDQANGDWLLSLDADEVLTPQLVAEIGLVLGSPQHDGYKIPRILHIADRPVMHGGFYPDAQLRLIRRGAGRFNDRLVHEAIKLNGSTEGSGDRNEGSSNGRSIGRLNNAMLHYAYESVEEFEKAMDKYAVLSAQEFSRRGNQALRTSPLNEVVHPIWTFFYRYVVRAGFLDGSLGLQLNLIYSDYVRRKIRYQRELK